MATKKVMETKKETKPKAEAKKVVAKEKPKKETKVAAVKSETIVESKPKTKVAPKATAKTKEKEVTYSACGKRKRCSAQVIMKLGSGSIKVNGVDINKYMPYETLITNLKQPLVLTETDGKFDIEISAKGGGFNGQTGAIRLGIAKALMEFNPEFRAIIKKNGMITRDARIKERKKYGLKKARRAPQFSKR